MKSSIGLKLAMALTGVFLVGFLFAHLSGNLLFFGGPSALNAYALMLHEHPAVLWGLRLGLIAAAVVHIWSALELTERNKRARPMAYSLKKVRQASFVSRSMVLSGVVILSFVLYHLAHFTFKWTHAKEFSALNPSDVHQMIMLSFSSPLVSLFYILSVCTVMLHLNHGISSIFRTLGLTSKKNHSLFRNLGLGVSLILTIGFCSIPLSVFLGIRF